MNKLPAHFRLQITNKAQQDLADKVYDLVSVLANSDLADLDATMHQRCDLCDAAIAHGPIFRAQIVRVFAYTVEARRYELTGRQGQYARYYM